MTNSLPGWVPAGTTIDFAVTAAPGVEQLTLVVERSRFGLAMLSIKQNELAAEAARAGLVKVGQTVRELGPFYLVAFLVLALVSYVPASILR